MSQPSQSNKRKTPTGGSRVAGTPSPRPSAASASSSAPPPLEARAQSDKKKQDKAARNLAREQEKSATHEPAAEQVAPEEESAPPADEEDPHRGQGDAPAADSSGEEEDGDSEDTSSVARALESAHAAEEDRARVQHLNDALVQQMAEMRREMEELRAATKGSSSVAANSRGAAPAQPQQEAPRALSAIAGNAVFKPIQPEPLTFKTAIGSLGMTSWLFTFERYMTTIGVAESAFHLRIQYWVALVDQPLLAWWTNLEDNMKETAKPIDTWAKFLAELKKDFVRDDLKEKAAMEFHKIHQPKTEPMIAFVQRVQQTLVEAGDRIKEAGSNVLAFTLLRAVNERVYPFTVSKVRGELLAGKITVIAQAMRRLLEEAAVEPGNAYSLSESSPAAPPPSSGRQPYGNRGPHKVNATETADSREGQESKDQVQLRVMVAALRAAGLTGPPAKMPHGRQAPGGPQHKDRFKNIKCFNCDEMGHYQADCNKERVCSRCKKPGHESRVCQNEISKNA